LDSLGEAQTLPREAGSGGAESVAPGERIGRFTVLATLGRGGMGLVLAAYDPHLDRRVAIKLVAADSPDEAGDRGKARLLREARAMARLRHPNVVSVHEVGEHRGRIYMAMEEVEGGTLRQQASRLEGEGGAGWRRIVDLYAAAGRGLAAAHAAGMVHRDFKPDNVLVGGGRVLVGDFGLVSGARAPAAQTSLAGSSPSILERLTDNDYVSGTPAYMAPEQYGGAEIDARADQFAFCVSLFEALHGQLPFAGDTALSYLVQIQEGAIRSPRTDCKVPAWLDQVLRRGLAANPDDRYASMNELLIELGADPTRARQLGSRERAILILGASGFIVSWAASLNFLSVELSYPLHYLTDLTFLLLLLALGAFGRRALSRSAFNRKTYGFALTAILSLILLTSGGQLAGLTADVVGALHLLVIGAVALCAAAVFERWFALMAVAYFAAFLVSAARPELFLPVCLAAHMAAAVSGLVIVRNRREPGFS
jgi:serine/threonine protein kinase